MTTSEHTGMGRRAFLQRTGIGVAAVATLSRAVAQGSAANSRVRLGVVGCGGRGAWIANLFAEHGGYEIAGVADYFAERATSVATKHKVGPERVFTGLKCAEKLVAAGGIDAVAIISPPYFHPAQMKAAVDAGLHIYLAKPVAVDVPGCQSIADSAAKAKAKGRVVLVDFQTRTNAFYREAIGRLHAGSLGEMCFGEATYHAGRLNAKPPLEGAEGRIRNWVFDQALSGDIIVEQNIHAIDVMSWIMRDAPPVRCSGTGGRRVRVDVGDAWDHYALVYEYPNNVGVTFSSRQFEAHGEKPDGIFNRMFGTLGVLSTNYGGQVMIRGKGDVFYRGGMTNDIYKAGAVANIAAFHEAMQKGDTTNATVAPSVTSNLVAIMGRMSTREGRAVTWQEVLATKKGLVADLSGLDA